MNLLYLQNALKFIVDNTAAIKSYHCGFADDVNRNIDNAYNQNNQVGTQYPHLHWVAPVEGSLDFAKGNDKIFIDLYLYDLVQNTDGDILRNDTYIKKWNRLKTLLAQVALTLKRCNRIGISGEGKYFTDGAIHNDSLVVVGIRLEIVMKFGCIDNRLTIDSDVFDDAFDVLITDVLDNEIYNE